jgi:hypothetical protein
MQDIRFTLTMILGKRTAVLMEVKSRWVFVLVALSDPCAQQRL